MVRGERPIKAYEGIQSALAAETARHNVATEGINWYSAQNLANLQFAQANKTTSEVGETTRHNLAAEGIQSGHILTGKQIGRASCRERV